MSVQQTSASRYSPKVSPDRLHSDQRLASARELLGFDLGPHGLWGNPARAVTYWEWVRDSRPTSTEGLQGFRRWIARFVGLDEVQSDPARHFALGFAQGIECALRKVPLPPGLVDDGEKRALVVTSNLPDRPSGKPLNTVLRWAAELIRADGTAWDRPEAWEAGVTTAIQPTRKDHLLCALLSAEFDHARAEQRFAARSLAWFLCRTEENIWEMFVRSTYPENCPEGRAIADSTRRSLNLAKAHQWRLRDFLLHAAETGRAFARNSPEESRFILSLLDPGERTEIERQFIGTSGSLNQSPSPEILLLALKNWLLEIHPELFAPRDTGAENLVLRHAYDYMWWRGFLENSPAG